MNSHFHQRTQTENFTHQLTRETSSQLKELNTYVRQIGGNASNEDVSFSSSSSSSSSSSQAYFIGTKRILAYLYNTYKLTPFDYPDLVLCCNIFLHKRLSMSIKKHYKLKLQRLSFLSFCLSNT